jgi:hypothetical protein
MSTKLFVELSDEQQEVVSGGSIWSGLLVFCVQPSTLCRRQYGYPHDGNFWSGSTRFKCLL